jgi:hypothetical protein
MPWIGIMMPVQDAAYCVCTLHQCIHLLMCLLLAAASCKQVVLVYPQGLECDYLPEATGLLPATTSKLSRTYFDKSDPEDSEEADDTEEGQCQDGDAADGQPQAAAAGPQGGPTPRGLVKCPHEQLARMLRRRQRRWGDAALRSKAKAETIRLGLQSTKRFDKIDCAAVFIARVGETKHPLGIVQEERDSAVQRWVSSSIEVLCIACLLCCNMRRMHVTSAFSLTAVEALYACFFCECCIVLLHTATASVSHDTCTIL